MMVIKLHIMILKNLSPSKTFLKTGHIKSTVIDNCTVIRELLYHVCSKNSPCGYGAEKYCCRCHGFLKIDDFDVQFHPLKL